RLPWGASEGVAAKDIQPGTSTDWIGLQLQDTCHYHLVSFSAGGQAFDIALRPKRGAVEREGKGAAEYAFFVPPYPGKGDKIVTPIEEIDAILKHLEQTPAIGKKPTLPLCYGGWMPLGQDNEYGRKYAQLYAAIGMRSLHPANSGPAQLKNLQAAGIPPSKSWMAMGYRNPPTAENIAAAKQELAKNGMAPWLLWYDYGDEIHFSEWMGMLVESEAKQSKSKPEEIVARRWQAWLKAKRPGFQAGDYWLPKWGAVDPAKLKPDSSAAAAAANPRLYVDSLLFYEDTAIGFVAAGNKAVKAALGEHVLCGANYSCHPFYYPATNMYIKWFRGGAAELGRHSEYFWQVAQPGPMINGYIAEHFRAGMRNNPKAVLRQYTMPHSPGNTEANFLRSAFSHLAHGAKMLDFFGIGMNETFTENHIDHRDHARYRAIRDVTHAIGLVEDLLPESSVVPSPVALLVSDSTERWDFAGIATDMAGHDHFGPNFRKTRLLYHLERLGLWKALTFAGRSPDLLIEEDLKPEILNRYEMLFVVGDCLPPAAVPVLEQWVKDGHRLVATATAGRYDPYRKPSKALEDLLGLKSRRIDERTTFFRPRQELPFLKPVGTVNFVGGGAMPQLAVAERIEPVEDAKVLARFKDDQSPAFINRRLGKGLVYYVAALPGVAYLWSALQPPVVPDRGPATHSIPTKYDYDVELLLDITGVFHNDVPIVWNTPGLDARLLKAPRGYILPIANYHKVGQKVSLSLQVDRKITRVTSAYHGVLPAKMKEGRVEFVIPALGYGDVLRLE
ncbi:MAG TPA: beta-galactosidase trimerization domain-containing protein, partial [Gemmataceae bacterium]|nr:beta-galactosidase trimerization domain-containing protein [Gemmataceae bacterium]